MIRACCPVEYDQGPFGQAEKNLHCGIVDWKLKKGPGMGNIRPKTVRAGAAAVL